MANLKEKTIVEIDVLKLNKEKFRGFNRNDGTPAKVATVEVVELDVHEVVLNAEKQPVAGGGMILNKIGFVVESQSKEEREAQTPSVVLGDAKRWIKGEVVTDQSQPVPASTPSDNINPDDIPF